MFNPTLLASLRRRASSTKGDARVALKLARALANPYRPLMAHVVVTRRCNLSCGYCHEYDKESAPVPLKTLCDRVEHLARLQTVLVTLTGGESLLHPDLEKLVAHIRELGMVPVMNTNGYLLTRERILALNEAGLFALQISVDNVEPNETTAKSLRPLRRKLKLLADHAQFRVRVNTVLGTGDPSEALEVAQAVSSLGFDAKVSLVRDAYGKVVKLDDRSRAIYDQINAMGRRAPSYLSEDFQLALMDDGEVNWKCRAGARYFTVCEKGLVHLCESSHGQPGIPLAAYSIIHIVKAFHMRKSCAPTCAVAYAHQASRADRWRAQDKTPTDITKQCWRESELVQIGLSRPLAA